MFLGGGVCCLVVRYALVELQYNILYPRLEAGGVWGLPPWTTTKRRSSSLSQGRVKYVIGC